VKKAVPREPTSPQAPIPPVETPPMKRLPMSVEMKIRKRLRKLKE
jgi:hypothetical protein